MNFTLVQILSYAVGIAAILGLVYSRRIDRAFFPFIFFLWAGFLNEIISTICISVYRTNAINSNIYVLLSSLLVLWQFKGWGLFKRNNWVFPSLVFLFIGCWIIDSFFIGRINRFNPYYRIFYSFTIVLMSIQMINRLFSTQKKQLIRNSIFLICICFIVFFTYKALIEIFWVYGLNSTRDFRVEVYRIMTYINLTVNLIYAIAILWMPRKQESLLLS